jgi:adenylosuccinate lyase
VLPEPARELVYYGATVQDLTDTWTGLVMRDVAALVRADLARVHAGLVGLAHQHRATPMLGRTHAQPGAPITFGLKAATWADEVGRHLDRLDQAAPRWAVGQLAGAVGALGFFDPHGPALRAAFCRRLGLADPGISWTTTRDRVAEFGSVLALATGTLARIGNEVLELQRPELGELGEARTGSTVGSITMPHKRNPEVSEHLDTLARVVRANAGLLVEGMTGIHERDGRSWKTEWAALPEVALCAGTAASLAVLLVEGLDVHTDRMAANLAAGGRRWASEQVLAALSPVLGKHRAQAALQQALLAADPRADILDAVSGALHGLDGVDAGALVALLDERVGRPDGGGLTADHPAIRAAVAMTDAVVARGART